MLYTHTDPVRWEMRYSNILISTSLGLNLRCHLYPVQTHCLSASLSSKINISTFSNNIVSKTYIHNMPQWDDIQSYQSSPFKAVLSHTIHIQRRVKHQNWTKIKISFAENTRTHVPHILTCNRLWPRTKRINHKHFLDAKQLTSMFSVHPWIKDQMTKEI